MAKPSSSEVGKAKQIARDNGISNPSAISIGPIFSPLYLAFVPLTSYITKPDSLIQHAIGLTLRLVPLVPRPVPLDRAIPALGALYVFVAFGATGAFSAAGQAMARGDGLDNNSPRKHIHALEGLPLRLRSAHYGLIENFPAWALAAALTQVGILGGKGVDQQTVNLLGLHVLLKIFVFYGAYIADIPPPRTLAHVLATSAVINVCWRLATGA